MLAIMSQAAALAMVASEVPGEAAVAAEPGEGALHHPTPGQDLEARHAVASQVSGDTIRTNIPIAPSLARP